MTPIVGFIKRDLGDITHLRKNDAEVDAIFTRTIHLLRQPHYKHYETYVRDGISATMPVYGGGDGDRYGEPAKAIIPSAIASSPEDDDNGQNGYVQVTAPDGQQMRVRQRRIWGLTGVVTQALLEVLDAMQFGTREHN